MLRDEPRVGGGKIYSEDSYGGECARLLGTLTALALKAPCPGNPLSPRQTRRWVALKITDPLERSIGCTTQRLWLPGSRLCFFVCESGLITLPPSHIPARISSGGA